MYVCMRGGGVGRSTGRNGWGFRGGGFVLAWYSLTVMLAVGLVLLIWWLAAMGDFEKSWRDF